MLFGIIDLRKIKQAPDQEGYWKAHYEALYIKLVDKINQCDRLTLENNQLLERNKMLAAGNLQLIADNQQLIPQNHELKLRCSAALGDLKLVRGIKNKLTEQNAELQHKVDVLETKVAVYEMCNFLNELGIKARIAVGIKPLEPFCACDIALMQGPWNQSD